MVILPSPQRADDERDRLAAQLAYSEEMRRTLAQELAETQQELAATLGELQRMNQILVAHFAAAPALSLQPPMLRVSASQRLRTRAVWLRQRAEHAHHRSRTLDACAQHLCHVAARLCSAPLLLPRARDALQHAELLRRVQQAREVG